MWRNLLAAAGSSFLLFVLTMPTALLAQPATAVFTNACLATPNRTIGYSYSLSQAVEHLRDQGIEVASNANTPWGTGVGNLTVRDKTKDSQENREALNIIQKAIASEHVAIIESCLFYGTSCAPAAPDPLAARAAISLVQTICKIALGGKGPKRSDMSDQISVSPSPIRFIQLKPNSSENAFLLIKNSDANPASFIVFSEQHDASVRFKGSCSTKYPIS